MVLVSNEFGQSCWRCIDCGKQWVEKAKCKRHAVTHIKTASIPCSLCPFVNVFKNRPSLDAHMLARHKGQREIDRC